MPKTVEKITRVEQEEKIFRITEILKFPGGNIYRVLDSEEKMGLIYFFKIFDNDMSNFFRANRVWGFFQKIICDPGLRPIIKNRGLASDQDFWVKIPKEYGGTVSEKTVTLWKTKKVTEEKITYTSWTEEEISSRRCHILAVFSGFSPEELDRLETFDNENKYFFFRIGGRKILVAHGNRNFEYSEQIRNFFRSHSKNEWEVICCFPKRQVDFKVIPEIKNIQEPLRVWFSHGSGEIFVTRDISPEELLLNNQIENSREQVGKVLRNLALSLPTE